MALPVSWNGTGLAAGALTTSSAGTGDTAFTEISNAPTISNTGTTAPRMAVPSGANVYAGWEAAVLGTIGTYKATTYFEFTSIASASWTICSGSTGATVQWRVDIAGTGGSPPGQLRLRNNSAQIAGSTQGLAASTLYRLEVSASGSSITATVYTGTTSTVAAGPITGTASASTVDAIRFGNFSSGTGPTTTYFDGMSVANPVSTASGAAGASSASTAASTATLVQLGGASASGATNVASAALAVQAGTADAGGSSNVVPTASVVLRPTISASASSNASAGLLSALSAVPAPATATATATASITVIPVRQASAAASAAVAVSVAAPTGGATGGGVPVPSDPSGSTATVGLGLPMRRGGYFVVIRDASLNKIGAIYPTNVRMNMRYNDVSDWSLNVPLDRTSAQLLRTPGAGVLIYRGDSMVGEPILTGPIGSRTINMTEDGVHITVEGPDDLTWVSGRVAFQMPGREADSQGTPTTGALGHDQRSGPAESVIKAYVNANAGPAALAARRRLTIETDGLRGSTVAGSARMTPLLDLIQPLAKTGGVGFKVVQTDARTLEFRVYVPIDRTKTARFGAALGNLTDWSVFEKAPSTTTAIVGGQGLMVNRLFVQQTDSTVGATWPNWRMETFQNRTDTALTTELNQTLAQMLLEGGPQVSVSFTTKDTERLQFGRDFRMGDRVSVEPWVGKTITDIVQEVNIDWTVEDGETVVTNVGTSETTGTPAIQRLARKLKVNSESVENVE